jgi:hypothetical protein
VIGNRQRTGQARVLRLDTAHRQATNNKRVMGLTEFERQLLLKELAEITAELDELQHRTAEITARVADPSSARLDRPA